MADVFTLSVSDLSLVECCVAWFLLHKRQELEAGPENEPLCREEVAWAERLQFRIVTSIALNKFPVEISPEDADHVITALDWYSEDCSEAADQAERNTGDEVAAKAERDDASLAEALIKTIKKGKEAKNVSL